MKSTFVLLLISVTCYALAFWDMPTTKAVSRLIQEQRYTTNDISFQSHNRERLKDGQEKDNSPPPKVQILQPEDKGIYAWNTQVRYAISVSDAEDGDSKYGEIKTNEGLLEIEYLPVNKEGAMNEQIKKAQMKKEHKGLALMKTSTCFGCHGDKTRFAGPSFSEIAEKYGRDASAIKNVGSHILKGSTGIWGNLEMPSHPDFTLEEAMQMASYMIEQGGNKYRWIYPGLEGSFRIMEKPENAAKGIYLLTASYTSRSKLRGQHSIILNIK